MLIRLEWNYESSTKNKKLRLASVIKVQITRICHIKSGPYVMFKQIVKAAKEKWCYLYPDYFNSVAFGHLRPWGKKTVMFKLCYNLENRRIKVHGAIADQLKEKTGNFDKLWNRANIAYDRAKLFYESEHNIVFAESNGSCPTRPDDIPGEINTIYDDLINLINDERLFVALMQVKAHLLGTPLDIWDYE
jgi:hypothetical protein